MTGALEGRTALVTGAGRRVGAAIARALAAEGMSLALHHHSGGEECERIAESVTARGGRAVVRQADLASGNAGRGRSNRSLSTSEIWPAVKAAQIVEMPTRQARCPTTRPANASPASASTT